MITRVIPTSSSSDPNNKKAIGLAADADGAGLVIADRLGKARVALVVLKDGSMSLVFMDPNGKVKVGVGLERDARPIMEIMGPDGKVVWSPVSRPKGPSGEQ